MFVNLCLLTYVRYIMGLSLAFDWSTVITLVTSYLVFKLVLCMLLLVAAVVVFKLVGCPLVHVSLSC